MMLKCRIRRRLRITAYACAHCRWCVPFFLGFRCCACGNKKGGNG